jgi:uncharacterized protein YjiS (DUF1127 family)
MSLLNPAREVEPLSLVRDVFAAVKDTLMRIGDRYAEAKAVAHMRDLPDHVLRDLGLHRSEIEAVVRGARPVRGA